MVHVVTLVAALLASLLALVAVPHLSAARADAASDGQLVPLNPTSLLDTRNSTITYAAGETTTGYDITRITATGKVTLKNNSDGATP